MATGTPTKEEYYEMQKMYPAANVDLNDYASQQIQETYELLARQIIGIIADGQDDLTKKWRLRAECRGVDPDIFFPNPKKRESGAFAKTICAKCVVKSECLNFALENNEDKGIWGDTTPLERRRIDQQKIKLSK